MVCYHVEIPDGVKVFGVTADGRPSAVLPGEYLVHQLPLKGGSEKSLFRFVGADASGRDVHAPLSAFRAYLMADSPRTTAREFADVA